MKGRAVIVRGRWNQWSTYENDRRFLPPLQRLTEVSHIRQHVSYRYALFHNRIGKLYLPAFVRKN